MAAEDYSKLTSDQWAKLTPPMVSENYAKLADANWNQSYGGHPAQSYHHHAHHSSATTTNNDYGQMQGYTNPNSKYWS